jgi:hypothetical protein
MTRLERSALAFLTKVLLRDLPRDGRTVLQNRRWRVVHLGQEESNRAFNAKYISWDKIEFEDETTRREFWTEAPLKNQYEGVIHNDERPHNKIRITAINANDIKVEDDDASYEIKMTSYSDVEMYSHRSHRTFHFKVEN